MRFWLWVMQWPCRRASGSRYRCYHAYVETDKGSAQSDRLRHLAGVLLRHGFFITVLRTTRRSSSSSAGARPDDFPRVLLRPSCDYRPGSDTHHQSVAVRHGGSADVVSSRWRGFRFRRRRHQRPGHFWGYRNFETPDASTNLPGMHWSLLTAGEALHNNHHHIQNAARFDEGGEFDPGYLYFQHPEGGRLASQRREVDRIVADEPRSARPSATCGEKVGVCPRCEHGRPGLAHSSTLERWTLRGVHDSRGSRATESHQLVVGPIVIMKAAGALRYSSVLLETSRRY